MSKRFSIESHIHRSLIARRNGSLCPAGSRTGTIGFHLGKHQRLVARIGDGVLHGYRTLPFNLPQVLHLGARSEAGLCRKRSRQPHAQSNYRKKSFHLFRLYLYYLPQIYKIQAEETSCSTYFRQVFGFPTHSFTCRGVPAEEWAAISGA